MSHFLYRPHIDDGAKVVTTDFLIRVARVIGPDRRARPLPVDLLTSHVELGAEPGTALAAPVAFVFSGDRDRYAAPAIALLDARIAALSAELAWSCARVSVSRLAIPLRDVAAIEACFADETPSRIDAADLVGSGRFVAALHPCGEPVPHPCPGAASFSLQGAARAEHRLTLAALEGEITT